MKVFSFRVAALSAAITSSACSGPASSPPQTYAALNYSPSRAEFLYAPDARTKIQAYAIDTKTGAITKIAGSPYPCAGGAMSSRAVRLALDPADNYLYCSPGQNRRIVGYAVDAATGALTAVAGSPFRDPNAIPTLLAATPDGAYLYAEQPNRTAEQPNEITAFTIDPATGSLSPFPGAPFGDPGVASYGMVVTPSGANLYVTETDASANGQLAGFSINPSDGRLIIVSGSPYPVNPNVGRPTVTPDGKFLYVPGTVNRATVPGFVTPFTIGANGTLTRGGYINVPGAPGNVAVTPSSKFAYVPYTPVSGDSGLAAFSIAADGELYQIQGSPFESTGDGGPDIVDPSGNFLYSAGVSSLWAYRIDKKTGEIALLPGAPFATDPISGPLVIAVSTASMLRR